MYLFDTLKLLFFKLDVVLCRSTCGNNHHSPQDPSTSLPQFGHVCLLVLRYRCYCCRVFPLCPNTMSRQDDSSNGSGGEDNVDKPSTLHLLRVFMGADDTPQRNESPVHKRPRLEVGASSGRVNDGEEQEEGVSSEIDSVLSNSEESDADRRTGTAIGRARKKAGCTIWDMTISEPHADFMLQSELPNVLTTILKQCDVILGQPYSIERPELPAVRLDTTETRCSLGLSEARRLREIACGITANVCAHQGLRSQLINHPPLVQELFQAFHGSDDPACLTELLRLFASAVRAQSQPPRDKEGEGGGGATRAKPRGVESTHTDSNELRIRERNEEERGERDGSGDGEELGGSGSSGGGGGGVSGGEACLSLLKFLVSRESLERVAFIIRFSMDPALLAHACSLAYMLMFHQEKMVVKPLVLELRVEEAFAGLLIRESNELSNVQVGRGETGLDVLLRCLEVLSLCPFSALCPAPAPAPAPDGAHPQTLGEAGAWGKFGDMNRGGDAWGKDEGGHTWGQVVRGLARVMHPWEHPRQTQESALLVLGNILEGGGAGGGAGGGLDFVVALLGAEGGKKGGAGKGSARE
ncbi:unnamed protein product, partial [Discosporangium mesarthrocarpum]